jgi:hypothetical protein
MSYMRGDLLTKTRKLVKGLAKPAPTWLKAMEESVLSYPTPASPSLAVSVQLRLHFSIILPLALRLGSDPCVNFAAPR